MKEPFFLGKNNNILYIDHWRQKFNILAGFSTRNGGVSESPYNSFNFGFHVDDNPAYVLRNREILAKELNVPLNSWVLADQIHGNNVEVVDDSDCGKGSYKLNDAIRNTDGLITNKPNILIAALFADCVPLFFLAKKNLTFAISHAGWKGTVGNIAAKTIQAFQNQSIPLEEIEVVIGPSICGQCYEVSEQVIKHVPDTYSSVYSRLDSSYFLNLKELNYAQLIEAGIQSSNIYVSKYCTAHDSQFFSHRRDDNKTGRMIGFITSQKR